MPPGLLPWSGSVRPKQPILVPAASWGSHFFFCSSLPYFQMGYITRLPCTLHRLRRPLSQRSISCMMRP